MKTSILIAAVIILHKVLKAKGNEKFECPVVECPTNVYRPICSRGKSYANLCVLKQEICKGNTAREIYDDVEACPGYEKEDDANGKSVETIDQNGVIFRHLIDASKKTSSASTEVPSRSTQTVRTIKKSYYTRQGRKGERSKRICNRPCSCPGRALLPFCILGNDYFRNCPLQLLLCKSLMRTKSCRKSGDREEETPFDNRMKNFLDVPVATRGLKPSENRGSGVDPLLDRKFCRIKCDPKEYLPICAGIRAFRNECYLKKSFCSGSVGKDILMSAKRCPRAQNRRKEIKNGLRRLSGAKN